MTLEAAEIGLLRRAAVLRVYTADGKRAPHKPLLLLLAVRRAQQGLAAKGPWSWWRDALAVLLGEYAPWGTASPQYPFRRLVGDGLWDIPELASFPDEAFVQPGKATAVLDLKTSWLDAHDPHAGLPTPDHDLLRTDAAATGRLVRLLLHLHFPPTTWQDIVFDVRIDHDLNTVVAFPAEVAAMAPSPTRRRAAAFAAEVLAADGRRCLICDYDGADTQAGHARPVGLDAAHVRWWHVDGPDDLTNGLALCATHHRLFDRGMYAFQPDSRQLVVSSRYRSGRPAGQLPQGLEAPERIHDAHLAWQWTNVFRGTRGPEAN